MPSTSSPNVEAPIKLVEGHDAEVARFVADWDMPERVHWQPGYRAFGVVNSAGMLVGGVVFDDWHPDQRRIELSARCTDPRAFGPRILRALGSYAFGKLDCHRVWARTSKDNSRARKFLKGIGFIEEGTQRDWYGLNRHAVMYRVTEPEWKERWGYERLSRAA